MLATDAGQAAVDGWARVVASQVDGLYVAVDMDCLDGADGWAVTMPEPDGLSLETAADDHPSPGGRDPGGRLRGDRHHPGQRRRGTNRRRRGGPGEAALGEAGLGAGS